MKPLFTQKQLNSISEYAFDCVYRIEGLFLSIEKEKGSKKVCFPSLFNLYWIDNDWIAHGKEFEGKPPKAKDTISKKDIIQKISNEIGITQKTTSEIISNLDKIIVDRISACGAKVGKFDLFGRGELMVEKGKISFSSLNQLISENPSEYIKKISLQRGEGFTKEKGGNLCELDLEMCTSILKKIKSRTKKLDGNVVGFETDPFHIPNGVTSLCSKTISLLSQHKGFLNLDALKNLETSDAKALATYSGCQFKIEGKGGWPMMRRCGFTLGGITQISEKTAQELSKFDDTEPSWVTNLNLDYRGEYANNEIVHDFSGLTSITGKALRHLAKLNGHINFNGLESINDQQARSLEKHRGGISLNGIVSITPEAAQSLAKMSAKDYGINSYTSSCCQLQSPIIYLEAIQELNAEIISALTKTNSEHENHPFALNFGKVNRLSLEMAKEFRDYQGYITISAKEIEFQALDLMLERRDFVSSLTYDSIVPLKSLSNYKGTDRDCRWREGEQEDLDLNGLTKLTEANAKYLSNHNGDLYLRGLKEISNAAATLLSKHKGYLDLGGLTELSDAAAKSLSKHEGQVWFHPLLEPK